MFKLYQMTGRSYNYLHESFVESFLGEGGETWKGKGEENEE